MSLFLCWRNGSQWISAPRNKKVSSLLFCIASTRIGARRHLMPSPNCPVRTRVRMFHSPGFSCPAGPGEPSGFPDHVDVPMPKKRHTLLIDLGQFSRTVNEIRIPQSKAASLNRRSSQSDPNTLTFCRPSGATLTSK
jgi:hypothetical protein